MYLYYSKFYDVRSLSNQLQTPIVFIAHSLGGLVVKAVSRTNEH